MRFESLSRILLRVLVVVVGCAAFGCASSSESGVRKTELGSGSERDDSLSVIPGPEYAAGWLHRVFLGDHYRDLWTATVQVPVLDLQHFAGGLAPVEAGGGFQTKSLRFRAHDGSYYKFRSVNKDPKAVLPLELQNTFAADLAQDHISTSHPAGALIVDELAGAVGVPRLHPRLVLLPDDPGLLEFRETFGGLLGILETYPDDGPGGSAGFLGSRKIQNTLKMFEGMEEDSEDRPDPSAFLTARVLDILVGDWDRHVKQWKWARFERDGRFVWYPIPLDRDQAFVRLDGVLPWIASMSISQFENFSESFNNIYKLTFSGQYLDRRLLVSIDRATWDSIVTVFVSRLTDDIIDRAVRQLPPEYMAIDGLRIIDALKARRDRLRSATDIYYRQLSDYVDIHLSDKKEYASITRLDDKRVSVTAWRMRGGTQAPDSSRQVYHRVFERADTKEIRLYMEGGDDIVVVEGDVRSSVVVRVIGGKGDDLLVDKSIVHGVLWGVIPFIAQADHMTYFYDNSGSDTFEGGPSCSVDQNAYTPPPGGIIHY
ncbi:MAG: hypothetical protein OEM41_04085 [Ignavibacteria bacterium]|nr:hypothetical protein [Ignavibacteria bacterium]